MRPPSEITTLADAKLHILELYEKISSLEGFRFYVPLIVSIGALIVAVATFFYNKKTKKRDLLRLLSSEVAKAKVLTEEIGIKMGPFIGKKQSGQLTTAEQVELDILNKTLESRNESVLNSLETACKSYYDGEVITEDFIESFTEDIRLFVDSHQAKYTPPFTSYPRTVEYYEDICRRRK